VDEDVAVVVSFPDVDQEVWDRVARIDSAFGRAARRFLALAKGNRPSAFTSAFANFAPPE
jgi:predicted nucleotidyltransferase